MDGSAPSRHILVYSLGQNNTKEDSPVFGQLLIEDVSFSAEPLTNQKKAEEGIFTNCLNDCRGHLA